jgi:DNA-binding transcriptional LysR family regulator
MHLVVREGTTSELAEGMEHGEYDFALTLLPLDRRLFEYEKVLEEELILAVPCSNPVFKAESVPERKHPAVNADILNGQKLVMLTEAQFMQKQLDNLVMDYKVTIRPAAVVKSLQAQIEMVKAGVGMALVPSGIERFCRDNEVVFYSFKESLPKREVVIMWKKDRKLSKAALELKSIIHSIAW